MKQEREEPFRPATRETGAGLGTERQAVALAVSASISAR